MRCRPLPRAGFSISEIGFGCMSLGRDNHENYRLIQSAFEAGINYFDTADVYQNGWSEECLAAAVKTFRKEIRIATKVGNVADPGGKSFNWCPSKSHILSSVDKSLKRLKTDYIDLYQLHGGTLNDNWDEIVETFDLLKQKGKILHYGISSIRPNVVRKIAGQPGWVSNMLQYSLLDRRPEEELLNLLHEKEVGVLVRGALAKGFLLNNKSSDYLNNSSEDVDLLKNKLELFSIEKSLRLRLVLGWVLNHKAVTSVVVGIRNSLQLTQLLEAMSLPMPEEKVYQKLSEVLPANCYTDHR
ncbi:aldo/keto reductase [Roseivirga sp. UBA1976]|uniref:aldo/keto reductase n=1 Tax=Roseivirga sp. UBA1976 TaxID=1947386 RepID=UPI00257C4C42|nr:aldo/keto reductase [Roseivirga sp. UBA1976]